jgi:hypothetical protein
MTSAVSITERNAIATGRAAVAIRIATKD